MPPRKKEPGRDAPAGQPSEPTPSKGAKAAEPREGKQATASPAISVLVADAQPLFADALALALGAYHWDVEVLAERPSSAMDVLSLVLEKKPDVTLVDYWLDMEGPALTRMILSRDPQRKVMLLSWFFGPRDVEHAFDAGAVGFLPKSLKVDQIAEAIRRAHAGELPVYAEQLEENMNRIRQRDSAADDAWQRLVDLTPREILVLKMLSLGKGVADIAKELFVSEATVRKHVFNTLKKLEAHSQLEAIALARQYGLLQT